MGDQERDFRLVEENVIKFRKLRLLDEEDVQTCDCRSNHPDGPLCTNETTCSNRGTRVECLIGFCSKARCQNMRLQKKQRASLRVIDAGCKGRGLVSNEPIKAGTMLSEYTGEVIPTNEYKRRMEIYAAAGGHFYIMGLPNGEYLDAARYGNHMRYMNHSCTPNAQGELWSVGAESRVAIIALRDIAPNEEIQIDYGWGRAMNETVCACGAPMCRWIIGIKSEYGHALKAMPIGEWRLPTGNDLLANGPSGLIGAWIRVMWVGDKGLNEDEFEFDDDDEMASEDDGSSSDADTSNGDDDQPKTKKMKTPKSSTSSTSALTPKSKAASMGLSKSAGDGTGGVFDRPQRIRRLMRIDSNAGGTWYTGRIVSYDKSRRIHNVQYSVDGEISEENLLEAIHSGSGCSKEPSYWMILNPARTRTELNALVQRTAMDPNKMIQYNHKIDPSVAALPKCPAFDLSVTELANLRLVFPDDRRESNVNWEAIDNKHGSASSSSHTASNDGTHGGNTSPSGLKSATTTNVTELSSSPTAPPEDEREYSVFVVPKATSWSGASRMDLPTPTTASTNSLTADTPRNPTPKAATIGGTSLSSSTVVTPSQNPTTITTATTTPLAIGISMDSLQKEREKELQRQKQREEALRNAAKQTAQANAQAEEQQREAARLAYQETLANAYREKLEAAKRAAAERMAMGIIPAPYVPTATTTTTTSISSSSSTVNNNKRSREDERKRAEQKLAERKEKKLQKEKRKLEKKKLQKDKRSKKSSSKRSRMDRSSGVKFTPPTTEIVPSALPLASKGISTYPFIGLPVVPDTYATDSSLMTDTVTSSSLRSSRVSIIQAVVTILTAYTGSHPQVDKKELLGKALLISIAAASTTVTEPSVAAAGIVLVTINASSSSSSIPDTVAEEIAQSIHQPVDVVRVAAEMVTTSLPSGSPSLLFTSFTFFAGNNALDHEPVCQPFTLLSDAVTILRSALFSSSSPLLSSSTIVTASLTNAIAVRNRIVASLPALETFFPSDLSSSSSLPSIIHAVSELVSVWTFITLPHLWSQVSPRAIATSIVYATVTAVVPSSLVLPYLAGSPTSSKGITSYLTQLETQRMKVEYVKVSHTYLQMQRWIESLRNLSLLRAHNDETRLTLHEMMTALSTDKVIDLSNSAEFAIQVFTNTVQPHASSVSILHSSSSLLAGRSLLPLASVPDLDIVRRTYDSFYGNEQIARITNTDDNSSSSSADTHLALRRLQAHELLTILRLSTNKWDDMANKSHEGRKQSRDLKVSSSSSSSASVYPSKEKVEYASTTLLADDTFFGKEHTKAIMAPSTVNPGTLVTNASNTSLSSDASSNTPVFHGKVSRHPHFLIPLYLFSDPNTGTDNGPLSISSSTLGGFEYCPHSLSGFSRSFILPALSITVRHRIAYQLLRAVGRAEDRNVVLNGLCPSSVLLDTSGHVRIDTYSYARIVTDRTMDKVMMLLGVVPAGTPPNKIKAENERLTELKNYLHSLALVDRNTQCTANWENSSLTNHGLVQLYSTLLANKNSGKEVVNNLSTTMMDINSIAPEILFGFPLPLPISDVWALGIGMAVAYIGESPFPSMQNLMEMYVSTAPIETDLSIVKLQARILGAVASIEAIMGPIHNSWSWLIPSTGTATTEEKVSIVPSSTWIFTTLATLRSSYPDLAPVGNATSVNEATEALRHRLVNHYGLRTDISEIIVRALTINPGHRPNARELMSAPVWKQEISTYSTTMSSISQETNLVTAREKLAPLLRLGNDTSLLSTRSSSNGSSSSSTTIVDIDTLLLSNLPSTRWPTTRNTVNNLHSEDIERYYDNESVDSGSSGSDSDGDDDNNSDNDENTMNE